MWKLSCRLCHDMWSPRRGTLHAWYQEHLRKHGLEEPKREEGETIEAYMERLIDWRNQYFEDSRYPYWKSKANE